MNSIVLTVFSVFACANAASFQIRMPPFLQYSSTEAKQDFVGIVTNPATTLAEKQKDVEELVARQPEEIQARHTFSVEKAFVQDLFVEYRKEMAENFEHLSEEAKEAISKMTTVRNDASLTAQEKASRLQEIFNELPSNVQTELREQDEQASRPLAHPPQHSHKHTHSHA